jgi:hypothetical protein
MPDLFDQHTRIHHHTVSDQADLIRVKDSGRDKMADKCFSIHHHGMAGVVAPLKADYQTGRLCQNVYNLSLAFVSPLGTDYHYIRHVQLLEKVQITVHGAKIRQFVTVCKKP